MANWNSMRTAIVLFAMSFAYLAPASAATLQPGEYACAGSSGILIGLGFKLKADSSYTDLDGGSPGRVVYEGSNIRFVGGHLDGQVGRGVSSTAFNIRSISCSHN
jgi:hypothetical protein